MVGTVAVLAGTGSQAAGIDGITKVQDKPRNTGKKKKNTIDSLGHLVKTVLEPQTVTPRVPVWVTVRI